jgi:hypothetical protein
MDVATLIERIERELQEQDPIFAALQEALSDCDSEMRFAVRTAELPDIAGLHAPSSRASFSSVYGSALQPQSETARIRS